MRFSAESSEDARSLGPVRRFANEVVFKSNKSIGGKNDVIRVSARYLQAFAESIPACGFEQCQPGGNDFMHLWRDNFEVVTRSGEQIAPARRG